MTILRKAMAKNARPLSVEQEEGCMMCAGRTGGGGLVDDFICCALMLTSRARVLRSRVSVGRGRRSWKWEVGVEVVRGWAWEWGNGGAECKWGSQPGSGAEGGAGADRMPSHCSRS